jgi:hypothetical protein
MAGTQGRQHLRRIFFLLKLGAGYGVIGTTARPFGDTQVDKQLASPVVAGALVGVGMAVAGVAVGYGLVNARTGDRSVTVRGLSERTAKADLALLPLRFAAAGDNLGEVQAQVEGDLATVRRFLAAEGYQASEVDLGQLSVVDQYAREYQSDRVGRRYQVAQSVIVRTTNVDRVQGTTR